MTKLEREALVNKSVLRDLREAREKKVDELAAIELKIAQREERAKNLPHV